MKHDVNAQTSLNRDAVKEKVITRGLNFYYDKTHALKDVDLSLYEGQVTAFIGRPAAASRRCSGCSTACMTSIRASAPRAR